MLVIPIFSLEILQKKKKVYVSTAKDGMTSYSFNYDYLTVNGPVKKCLLHVQNIEESFYNVTQDIFCTRSYNLYTLEFIPKTVL